MALPSRTTPPHPRKAVSGPTRGQKRAPSALAVARTALAHAAADLIDPRICPTDQGNQWTESWYHQLRSALAGHNSGGNTCLASFPPLWIDAQDTLAAIDARVRHWEPRPIVPIPCTHCGDIPNDWPTVLRLRSIIARKWRPQDVKAIHIITNEIDTWVSRTHALFDAKPKYLPDPCPNCGSKDAYYVSDGERKRLPGALEITVDGCECKNCGTHWPPEHLAVLGRALGYPPPAGTT